MRVVAAEEMVPSGLWARPEDLAWLETNELRSGLDYDRREAKKLEEELPGKGLGRLTSADMVERLQYATRQISVLERALRRARRTRNAHVRKDPTRRSTRRECELVDHIQSTRANLRVDVNREAEIKE